MVKLNPCECGPAFLIRMNRSCWMRLIPTRRLYYCARCDMEMFLTRDCMQGIAIAESSRSPLAAPTPVGSETSVIG